MKTPKLLLLSALSFTLTLASAFPNPLTNALVPTWQSSAQAAELQSLENRSYISFYPLENTPLNVSLLNLLRKELPQFGFQELGVGENINIEGFLEAVKSYQQSNPQELSKPKEGDAFRFDDRVVTWADTRQAAFAAFVLVPHWQWGSIELVGPRNIGNEAAPNWVLEAQNPLTLTLDVYKMGKAAEKLEPLTQQLTISKQIPIQNIEQLLQVVSGATGVSIDLSNPDHQKLVLDVVKKIPAFQQLQEQDPASTLAEQAFDRLQSGGLSPLLASLRPQLANVPDLTRPQPNNNSSSGEGIGLLTSLKLGSVPFGYNEYNPLLPPDVLGYFVPAVELGVDYSLGQLLGWKNTYISLSAGSTVLPMSRSPFAQQQLPPVQGVPVQNPLAAGLGISAELGIIQRWEFGDFLLKAGARGGMLTGLLLDSFVFTGMPTMTTFGGTVIVGGEWRLTPNFLLGLDTGFRYYAEGYWYSAGQPVAFSPVSALGPVLQLTGTFAF